MPEMGMNHYFFSKYTTVTFTLLLFHDIIKERFSRGNNMIRYDETNSKMAENRDKKDGARTKRGKHFHYFLKHDRDKEVVGKR